MGRTKAKSTDRILLIILSIAMVIAMIPVTFLSAFSATDGAPDSLTVSVISGTKKIPGAIVKITNTEYSLELSATTDDNGIAAFETADIEDVLQSNTLDQISVIITITKDGYTEKTDSSVLFADNLNADIEVEIVEAASNTATVSVSVIGDATVEINGVEQNTATVEVGTQIPVKITPAAGSYIKDLVVDGETVEVAKGEAYECAVTADENIVITATAVKEFTVSAPAVEGGAITLNGENKASLTVDENTEVTVDVSVDEGYRISSVAIGGSLQALVSDIAFSETIPVTANIEIIVVFSRVYTVVVTHNSNGTVITDPTTTGGSVTVVKDSTVTITADPDDNYRVSEVKINGVDDEAITGVNYGAEDKYIKELVADKDYTVVITFAPNKYNVTVGKTENGTVIVEPAVVDYNGSATVTLHPESGYTVKSVKVNGEDTDVVAPDDATTYFVLENIVEDKNVVVAFEKTATADMNNVSFNTEDALRANSDGTLYVFAKGATVTFETTKNGIRLYDENGKIIGGASNKNTVSISKTTSIGKISLYYKAEGEKRNSWHDIPVITKNNPLNIVIDADETETTIAPAESNAHGYYNFDVPVTISTEDKGDYSGIASVEYWIATDGIETKRETRYTYETGKTIQNKYSVNIIIDATVNNSDNVVVGVKVTDRAGNVETKTSTLKINSTKPSVSVSIDGSLHAEATECKYNTSRTATVTYVDRDTTFDQTAAIEGIGISAKDAAGKDVAVSKAAMIKWSHRGGTHTATISFTADANYQWSVSYTNKAGLCDDEIEATGDSVYEFAVDTTAPVAEIELDKTAWEKLISALTFGIYKSKSVTAVATASDATTGTYDILYYKSNEAGALSKQQLEQAFANGEFSKGPISVDADERFAVYARATDLAGNTTYVSTDGVIYDASHSVITITPPAANEYGYYNKDVVIQVTVSDAVNADTAYSGIKSITYVVEKDGKKTQEDTLYTFDIENPTYAQLKSEWSGNITVESGKNNSDNIKVTVKVVDNAANEYEKSAAFSINTDVPTSTIVFDDTAQKVVLGHGYYNASRTATITVKDRATSFNKETATEGITFSVVDAEGKSVPLSGEDVVISDWTSAGDHHTAAVTFNKDGNYTWSFKYVNNAGLAMEKTDSDESYSPYSFTVDKTDPTGTVSVNTNTWDKLLNVLTFGLYSNVKADVTATLYDATSPYIVEYIETSNPIAMTEEELDNEAFKPYKDYSVEEDKQFVVYLKITDYAGNYIYVSSDGYIVDTTVGTIALTPSQANDFYDADANANGQYGIYNKKFDVTVDIRIDDSEPYSGIKTVDYWVENNDIKTQEGNLFTFDIDSPTQKDLVKSWSRSIKVDKALNNGCNVVVYVKTVDNAGNEHTESVKLDIDNTAPEISVEFDNNKDNNGNTYFDAQRTATVVITERKHHFDPEAATDGIIVSAVDAKGNNVENAYTISTWTTVDNAQNPDAATHTATIFFEKDANYTWSIAYTDKAGNANDGIKLADGTVASMSFTVDTTDPYGTVKATSAEGREAEWDTLRRDDLTFGFWSKDKITVTATYDDLTSAPIAAVEYYKVKASSASDGTTALKKEELDAVKEWMAFDGLDISSDEQLAVYIRITDLAGNYTYVSTNGLIVDHTKPLEETIAPEIIINPQQPINGLYNGDVNVDIKVVDPLVGGTYSGLKTVTYKVLNMGIETQSGTLLEFEDEAPKQSDLVQTLTETITVDSELNNSNDVVIVVYAEDNSLNSSEDEVKIKIDITAPTIVISYDNNNVDSNAFFKADRIATVVIAERNFDAGDVVVAITSTDGVAPTITEFTKQDGTGNGDDTTWTATINYAADGDYTFDINYTDLAGNKCTGETFAPGTLAPNEFTIDKISPVVSVTYDNNDAQNGNYYKAVRTATVVITEHNFNPGRVTIAHTATDDGVNTTRPTISGWTSSGDRHTATIYYGNDAKYTFDIAVNDNAGNASADYTAETFFVDTTMPKLEIGGVADNSANKGDVIPVVSYSDTNYDADKVTITLTGANRKAVELDGEYADVHNGSTFTFKNFAAEMAIDDIYTLTATLTDKAGNTTTQTITFSVNRFGSTYALSDAAERLNGTYVKKAVDVVLTETNADELSNIKITLFKDGKTIILKEEDDYSLEVVGGKGQWYRYTYTVFAKNFASDGVYELTVESDDKAGNASKNDQDTKDTAISFGVDSTLPLINVENLEGKTTYALESMTVKMSIKDNLKLATVIVELDGKEYKMWSGKEVETIVQDGGNFTFDISGDSTNAHNLVVYAIDAAGNGVKLSDAELPENAEKVENFYVTTNLWVRYYTNKPLFFGSLAGVIVLAGLIVIPAVYKKKKGEKN